MFRAGHRTEERAKPDPKAPDPSFKRLSRELPEYLKEAKQEVAEREGFSSRNFIKKMRGLWEKFSDIAPAPWNKALKFGAPVAAATCGVVFYQAVIQLGIEALKTTSGLIQPLAVGAAFLVPIVAANKLLSLGEKLFHADPVEGRKRQAILRPAQGIILLGAAIWAQTMNLSMLTYGVWAAAAVGTALLTSKLVHCSSRKLITAAALALVLQWGNIATQRSFDVTVLSAGPDPEVAAWNIGTDLSVKDHWKGLVGLGSHTAPTGRSGMVLINRDVPLYLPPHRSANFFNAHFSTLVGKQVRTTTIGGWMKFISPELQPTIVIHGVAANAPGAVQVLQPPK